MLTPAEWRVLELVRAGLPNAEIATRLGITIPTVKTHVTHILVKTDRRDRLELAQWDGEPADTASADASRGFSIPGWLTSGVTATGAKVLGGSVAAVAFAGALLLIYSGINGWGGGGLAASSDPLIGFYIESTHEYAALSGQPYPILERASQGTARRWYVDEQHWRAEVESHSSGLIMGSSTIAVAHGDQMLIYDRLRNTYTYLPAVDGIGDAQRSLLGPAPGDEVDAVIAALATEFNTEVRRAGTAEQLGLTVEVLEYEVEGGTHRVFIDPVTMFVLLHEVDGGDVGRSRRFEATRFEARTAIDRDLLRLTLPARAEERVSQMDPETGGSGCPDSGSHASSNFIPSHQGFFVPAYLPDGWGGGGAGTAQALSCEMIGAWATLFAVTGEGYLIFEQSLMPNGIPGWFPRNVPVDVAGHEGFRAAEGALERLVWKQDDVVLLLESDTAPFEELLRIAESVQLVVGAPDDPTPTPAASPQPTALATSTPD